MDSLGFLNPSQVMTCALDWNSHSDRPLGRQLWDCVVLKPKTATFMLKSVLCCQKPGESYGRKDLFPDGVQGLSPNCLSVGTFQDVRGSQWICIDGSQGFASLKL